VTLARNARTSSGGTRRPRHWLAFFAKICSALQPCATARSTARGSPPATDMCAPRRTCPERGSAAELFGEETARGIEPDRKRERLHTPDGLVDHCRPADEADISEADGGGARGIVNR